MIVPYILTGTSTALTEFTKVNKTKKNIKFLNILIIPVQYHYVIL